MKKSSPGQKGTVVKTTMSSPFGKRSMPKRGGRGR